MTEVISATVVVLSVIAVILYSEFAGRAEEMRRRRVAEGELESAGRELESERRQRKLEQRRIVHVLLIGPSPEAGFGAWSYVMQPGETRSEWVQLARSIESGAWLIIFGGLLTDVRVGDISCHVDFGGVGSGVARLVAPVTPGVHIGFKLTAGP